MMRIATWIVFGWLLLLLQTSVGPRLLPWHLCPDIVLVVITFVAMRNDVLTTTLTAFFCGLVEAHLVGAHKGLFIGIDVLVALVAFRLTGQFSGRGFVYAASMAGAMAVVRRVCVVLALYWGKQYVGFASLTNALIVPDALATAALAAFVHPLFLGTERRLDSRRQKELMWR